MAACLAALLVHPLPVALRLATDACITNSEQWPVGLEMMLYSHVRPQREKSSCSTLSGVCKKKFPSKKSNDNSRRLFPSIPEVFFDMGNSLPSEYFAGLKKELEIKFDCKPKK
uniref:Uncharacterized protein n=1 Tax=Strigamia maritima TaxID=126957 RepID=T1JEC4_STRMM